MGGGDDVVLGVQWLQSLVTMDFNFQKLFLKFSWEGKEFLLNGITGKPSNVINSNGMKTLLKKGKQGVNTQLYSQDVQTCKALISPDIQRILKNPSKVFEGIPISHPPIRDLENDINLNMGSVPSIIRPYKYLYG